MKKLQLLIISILFLMGGSIFAAAQDKKDDQPKAATVDLAEWRDEFTGDALNEKDWEQYSMEGGGTIKVSDGKLFTNGKSGSRAGIRSKKTFDAEKFIVSTKIAAITAGISEVSGTPTGNAILSVMFDNNGTNRLEWVLTTEGRFEAWLMRDGKTIRLDGKNLGTKEKTPTIGIARRGDEFFFMLNGEIGFQKKIKNLPTEFRVMVYGYGTSNDEWDMISVITTQK